MRRRKKAQVQEHPGFVAPETESIDWSDDRAQKEVDLELVYQAIRTVRGQIGEWKVQQRLASAGIQGGPRADACERELSIANQRLAVLADLAAEVKASETGLGPRKTIVIPQTLVVENRNSLYEALGASDGSR